MKGLPSLRKLGALFALISLGALVVWFQDINLPAPRAPLPEKHGEPDYYVEEARLTRFNNQGQRLQTLKAKQVTHYPEKDLSLFEKPLLHHYSEQGQVWQVVAEQAEHLGEDTIYLENKVVITPLDPDSVYLPEFSTERLWVDTQTGKAHTPDPVSFISPGGNTNGQGLEIYMNTGLAEILQAVEGHYLPSPATQDAER